MRAELIERLAALPGGELGEGAFAPGPAVWVGGREIAHFDSDDSLDVRLTRAVIRDRRGALKLDDRIVLRSSSSDWLEVRLQTPKDVDFAVSMVADAIAANLPTAPRRPPLRGEELERRRRFH